MSMIERVMQKMRETGLDCEGWDDEPLRELARAAIAAMREPTPEMVKAAKEAVFLGHGDDPPEDVWPAMIDAALTVSD